MVKSGQAPRPVTYQNRRRPLSQLEVVPLARFVTRLPNDGALERLEFHIWVMFTAGHCKHMVDFEDFDCRPGSVLHIRPGQVHQWGVRPGLEGTVVMMTQTFAPPVPSRHRPEMYAQLLDDDTRSPVLHVPAPHRGLVEHWFTELEKTWESSDDSAIATQVLKHLAAVAVLEVFRHCRQDAPSRVPLRDQERMRQFRLDVERSFRVTREVGDYAKSLKISAKTLDRTVRAASGVSAKDFIDQRVMLEAKRFCAHSDAPIDHIGDQLGFSEATNFVKFFKARMGTSPGAFRASLRPPLRVNGQSARDDTRRFETRGNR